MVQAIRFRFVWWLPCFGDWIVQVIWLCLSFTGTEGGWCGSGHKQVGRQQYCFCSYSGLESSLNCLIQPWWGCPELNLNLCKSHSCTHRVNLGYGEVHGVLEVFVWIGKWEEGGSPSPGSSKLLYCLCDCWRLELLQWRGGITQALGCCAQPHPERAPSAGHGRTEKGQELLKCNLVSDTHFVLVLDCFCACTVLGLVSKLIHKNNVSAQEKRGMYRPSYWWEIEAWVWVSLGSSCTLPTLHPEAEILQQSGLTWVNFDSLTASPCHY